MKNLIDCPAERAVYFLGGKWKIRILFGLLRRKKMRFGEFKKSLKTITQQMLSKQLKELEADGIINRKVIQIMPPNVEYSLTEFGLSVMPILKSFSEWNKKNRFGELKKVLQTVTQQMLSKQLKELEIDGLINRKVFQVVPPKVEYSLTDFGTSVIPVLRSLDEWNRRNSRTISTKLNKNFEESRIR